MIVKSFIADSVAGALKMVRSELGGDAVILKTRKLDPLQQRVGGGRVEVTACIDQPGPPITVEPREPEARRPAVAPAAYRADLIVEKLDFLADILQLPGRARVFSGAVGRLFTTLLKADFPEALAHDVAERLSGRFENNEDSGAVTAAAAEILIDQLPDWSRIPKFQTNQKIVLVGPPGAGKTSLMGRLAGYLLSEKRLAVCLASLDQVKVSAPEEFQTYAAILDVDHYQLSREIDRAQIDRRGQEKVTLIDMPAVNPKDPETIGAYAEKLARIKPHRVIGVFSALYRSGDLFDMIRAFKPFGLTELAFTMTDQTTRLGAMMALSIQSGLPISLLGTGQKAVAINPAPDSAVLIRSLFGAGEVTGNA